jgi:hypothetical protein
MKKLILAILAAIVGMFVIAPIASAADVYEGYSRVGSVTATSGGKYAIKVGYANAGSTKPSYGGKWDVYEGYSSIGSVKGGPGGPAAGAALLLLVG